MNDRQTLIEQLDATVAPFWVYSQARKNRFGPWAGPVVVAQRSGLSHRTVTRIGFRTSWKGIDADVMSAFIAGCGFTTSKWGPIVMNKSNSYKRYCAMKAIRPMKHLNNFIWRLFNKSAEKWNKEQEARAKSTHRTEVQQTPR